MITFLRIIGILWICFGAVMLLPLYAVITTAIGYRETDPDMYEGISMIPTITLGAIALLFSILSLTNGILMLRSIRRRFSIGISVVMCLAFPVGTILSFFSFFVLTRPSIREKYKS